jgi:Tol biopolymer transport system component
VALLLAPAALAGCSWGGWNRGPEASGPVTVLPADADGRSTAVALGDPRSGPRRSPTAEADFPDLDRRSPVEPPQFGGSRTFPLDPEDPAAGGVPAELPDSFAQVASLWGNYADYYDGPALGRDRFDGSSTLVRVTDSSVGYTISPNVSRDGRRLVFSTNEFSESADIFVRRVDGSTKTRVTYDAATDIMPVFSPDGREIAYASNREGSFDIYVIPAEGGAPTRLTNLVDDALHPTFSPDGRRIAYCRLSSRTNRWEIWMVDRDTGQEKLLHYGMFPEWNPDPARPSIVFQQGRERSRRFFGIWTIDIVDGEASAPTEIASAENYACMHPTWSPDGTRIAFVAVPGQDIDAQIRPTLADIWIVGADGRERRQLTLSGSFNTQPSWSRDGSIYFTSDRSGMDNVWALRDPDTLIRRGGERMTNASADDAAAEIRP